MAIGGYIPLESVRGGGKRNFLFTSTSSLLMGEFAPITSPVMIMNFRSLKQDFYLERIYASVRAADTAASVTVPVRQFSCTFSAPSVIDAFSKDIIPDSDWTVNGVSAKGLKYQFFLGNDGNTFDYRFDELLFSGDSVYSDYTAFFHPYLQSAAGVGGVTLFFYFLVQVRLATL